MAFPLSFTTLGCPTWSWQNIVDRASVYGYQGIELRGVEGEMDLTKVPEFNASQIERTKRDLAAYSLSISCIDTSCRLHEPDAAAGMDEARRSVDLAAELGARFIRVFGDKIPETDSQETILSRVGTRLVELGEYAEPRNVQVLIESHGDFSESAILRKLLDRAQHDGVGLLWDSHHPYRMFDEPVGQTYGDLKDRIRHVHVKDSVPQPGGAQYVLPGQGDVPLGQVMDLLASGGYDGWLSFEWEKRWHQELEEPEVAFPAFVRAMRELEGQASS